MDIEFAMNRIITLSGTKFDPVVVNALDSAVRAGKIRLLAALVEV
jgi:HD-GYP domain-containing protein (c-di-GMP phosphodiesterase class II)